MVFVNYECAGCKKEVRELLRQRLILKDKIRYHEKKIKEIENVKIPEIEEKLNFYLERSKN